MGSCEHTFNNWTQKIIAVLYLSEIWVMKDDHQRNPNNSENDHIDLYKMYNYYKGNLCNRKEIMLLGDLLLTFGITTTSPPGALAYNPRRKRNDEVQGFLALLWAPLVLCWRLYRKSMIMFQLRLFVSCWIMERLSEIFNNTDNFYKLK